MSETSRPPRVRKSPEQRRREVAKAAREIARRLAGLFKPDETGARPVHGEEHRYAGDPHWRELVLFYEYFHGESGKGLGASHQTGWTALVTRLLTCHDLW